MCAVHVFESDLVLSRTEADSSTSPAARVIHIADEAQMLGFECLNLIGQLDDVLGQLQSVVDGIEQKIVDELAGFEAWLGQTELLLLAEPIREFEPCTVCAACLCCFSDSEAVLLRI